MQVAVAASFGHFRRPMKIARGRRRGARANTRGNTRKGPWESVGIATCICQGARVEFDTSGLANSKASPSSPTPTASTLEADWPATLAGYPSTAAVAKPFGCRSSSTACIADDMHASVVLIESSVCHVALTMTRAALQPELSMCTSIVDSSSRMISMLLTTGV